MRITRTNLVRNCLFAILTTGLGLGSTAAAYERSLTTEGLGISWCANGVRIPYVLNAKGSDDVPFEALENAVVQSFEAWSSEACTSLDLAYEGVTNSAFVGRAQSGPNENLVVFQETEADWIHPRDVIALTTVTYCRQAGGLCQYIGHILDADIELNGAYVSFSVDDNPPAQRFDIQNSLTHEVGHLIGFDHNCSEAAGSCSRRDREATMYESAPAEEVQKRTLAADDLEGVCAVYPIEASGQKCEETVVVDTNDAEIAAGTGCDCGIHRIGSGHSGASALALVLLLGLRVRWRR